VSEINFWGGKLDGVCIDTSQSDKKEWLLFDLMKQLVETKDAVGALYYYGEHYIIRKHPDGYRIAQHVNDGELFVLLDQIKNGDFPEDKAYFF